MPNWSVIRAEYIVNYILNFFAIHVEPVFENWTMNISSCVYKIVKRVNTTNPLAFSDEDRKLCGLMRETK